MERYVPQVLIDRNARPFLVFRKGRTKYHAIEAGEKSIALVALDTLRDLRPLLVKGEPYPPKRAASRWLNRDHREVTKKASQILRALVARKGTHGSVTAVVAVAPT